MNTVTVFDKYGNEWGYIPQDGYDLVIDYRNDKSLLVVAQIIPSKSTGTEEWMVVIAAWSEGSWAHAMIQGSEE